MTNNIVTSTDLIQLTLTLKMTTAQVVETSLTINNSSIQDYVHADDHSQPTYEVSSKITSLGSVILIIIINVTLTKSIMLIFLIIIIIIIIIFTTVLP